jgi:hypothetical protein
MSRKHAAAMAKLAQLQADPDARAVIEVMLPQLVIVLVNRMGGEIEIPISEIDGTGPFNLSLQLNPDRKSFTFVTGKK